MARLKYLLYFIYKSEKKAIFAHCMQYKLIKVSNINLKEKCKTKDL